MDEKYVACGIIIDKKSKRIFCCKRSYGDYKGFWEFPGGKVENGETSKEAVIRELKEELDVDINVEYFLNNVKYAYSNFHLNMDCFVCTITNGNIKLIEASDFKWITLEESINIEWLPADEKIIEFIYLPKKTPTSKRSVGRG